jgi:hypothetical protein
VEEKGKGFWKINNSILNDKDYQDKINDKVFTFLKKLFFVVLQFGAYKQTRVNIVSFIFIFSKIILPSVSIN